MKLNAWHTVVVVILAVGCGAAAPVEDGSILPANLDPTTTTSEGKLTTLQKLERDYMGEQLLVEADAIARELSKGGTTKEYYQEIVRHYVPVYMADICVKGSQPFAQGFTAITWANLSAGRGPDVEALRVIKALDDVRDTATHQCLQPYLHPESISDASPAIELYLASRVMALSYDTRDSFKSVVRGMAAGWFQTDQQDPFISWLCQQFNDNPCGL